MKKNIIADNSGRNGSSLMLVFILAFVYLAIHLLCDFVAARGWLWGVCHLSFFPWWQQSLFIGLSLAATLAIYLTNRRGDTADSGTGFGWVLAVIILTGISFYYFRSTHFLYGDGYGFMSQIGEPLWPKFSKEIGEVFIHRSVFRLVKAIQPSVTGLGIYQWISIISGWIFLAIMAGYLYVFKSSAIYRWLTLLIFLGSGAVMLFYGHPENYSIFNLSVFLYFILASAAFKTGKIFWPTIVLFFSIWLHFAGIVFLPAHLLLIYFCQPTKMKPRKMMIVIAIALAAGAGLWWYFSQLGFSSILLSLVPSADRPYAILSVAHLADMANALLLSVPLTAAIIILSGKQPKEDREISFYFVSALGAFLGIFLLDVIYEGADWDLMSFIAWPLMFWAIKIIRGKRPLLNPILLTSVSAAMIFIHSLPWVISNNSLPIAVSQFSEIATRYNHKDRMMLFARAMMQMNNSSDSYYPYVMYVGQRAIKKDPNDKRVYQNMTVSSYQMKRYEEAIKYYQQGYSHGTQNADILITVGRSYLFLGKLEKAALMLEQAIEVNPNYVELHYDIGYAQSYSGQFEQAEINLQKSLGHFPQRKETMVLMVYNYFSWGKYDKALKVIKQLLLLNQNDIKSWHTRGVIEFMAGRRSEARQSWEKALQIEPENQDLMELIRRFDRGKLTKEMLLVK